MTHVVEDDRVIGFDGAGPLLRAGRPCRRAAAAIMGGFIASGWAQTPLGGIRPLDSEGLRAAIRDGEEGRVPPSAPFSLRFLTIREGKAAEDPIGPMDETGLRGVEARAPFSFLVLSPYVRVALAAAEAKRAGQPRPDTRIEDADTQVVTVRVSPGTAFATADAIESVTIDRGESSWHPVETRIKPFTVHTRSGETKQLAEGEFDLPVEVFEPSAPITLVMQGRRGPFRWTITRTELARLK
jgi:hypothetical protein